ncbi:MAG: hypothetical protein IGQ88_07975 [Gloeomargaritaceae cyanobacterium C42_A2020_066]|nr:hypothetical protein [Gloeomargaritaceae cyanobacterium C42_A2020_066]
MSEAEAGLDLVQVVQQLRRKEGTWVAWGLGCAQLQKAGHRPEAIFEQTGFEPALQNQLVVAAQVYQSLQDLGTPALLEHYQTRGNETLYELRLLSQTQRVAVATLALHKGLDSLAVREVVKAVRERSQFKAPAEFTDLPGDAVAFQCWRLVRQQDDLAKRSQLIARGLAFAQSESARSVLEKALLALTAAPAPKAPLLPLYRLEAVTEQPRIVPLAGRPPLTPETWAAVPTCSPEGVFGVLSVSAASQWVALPQWQALRQATDPVAVVGVGADLPGDTLDPTEPVLLVVDRANRVWDTLGYSFVETAGRLTVRWLPEAPEQPLFGRVVVVVRAPRILDEQVIKEPWQLEE